MIRSKVNKKVSGQNIKIGINPITFQKEHKNFYWKNVHLAEQNLLSYMKGLFNWANTIII